MKADARTLASGLRFPEAPRWRDNHLFFSDMLDKRICQVDLDGNVETVAQLDDMPGGLGFRVDGTLLAVGMNTAQLFALVNGEATMWCDLSGAASHLDDMVVTDTGVAYVGVIGPKQTETQSASGKLLRVTPTAEVAEEASGLAFPNGCAVSPDNRQVYVNETMASRVLAFDLADDGSVTRRRTFAELPGLHPDGLALDAAGAVWIGCYAEHLFLRVEDGGRVTDVIEAGDRWATGVELGGADGRTLFMTSSRTDIRGFFRGEGAGQIDIARVEIPGARA